MNCLSNAFSPKVESRFLPEISPSENSTGLGRFQAIPAGTPCFERRCQNPCASVLHIGAPCLPTNRRTVPGPSEQDLAVWHLAEVLRVAGHRRRSRRQRLARHIGPGAVWY